jgi:hypothetical protein
MPESERPKGFAAKPERRREPRWPCRTDVAIMLLSSEAGFTEAEVIDFSERGLGLRVPQPLRGGEQIVVKTMLGRTPLMLIYNVRRCEADGPGFQVGAEFAGAITSPDNDDEQALHAAFIRHLEAMARGGAKK